LIRLSIFTIFDPTKNDYIMKKTFTMMMSLMLIISVWGQGKLQKEIDRNDLKGKSIEQIMQLLNPHLIWDEFNQHESHDRFIRISKSQEEVKQGLDSIVYYEDGELFYEERYTYNIQGKCVLFEELAQDNGIMKAYQKSTFSYNVFGDLISYSFIVMSEELGDWQTRLKTDFTYQDGLLDYALIYFIDFDLNELQLMLKDEFTYDNQNRLITTVSSSIWEDVWTNSYKEEIAYNSDGYAYLWTSYNWDTYTNAWTPEYKDEDFYNDNGDIEMYLQSEYSEMTTEWEGKYRNEYTYNDNHQMLDDVYSEFEDYNSQWNYFDKDSYTYDAQGNFTVVLSYNWSNSAWVESQKDEFTYDYNYTFDQILVPWVGEYDFETENMLTKQKNYEWSGGIWQEKGEAFLHYSERNVNSIEEISSSDIQIYPNPSTGNINVNIAGFGQEFTISIIDITGKTIERSDIINASSDKFQTTYDLNEYSQGVYFVRINNSNKTAYQKIILQ